MDSKKAWGGMNTEGKIQNEELDSTAGLGLKALFKIPLFFLGIGIYRAWIELAYVRPLITAPSWEIAGHDAYDFAMVASLLIMALFARKIAPLISKKAVLWLCGTLMVASSALIITSYYIPSIASVVAFPAAIIGGVGTAIIILLWSELYSCLNPFRVALYYSGSLMVGVLIVYLLKGFIVSYFYASVLLLPIASLLCLARSYTTIPEQERPKGTWGKFSFPWKPVALMAVYAFAYGLTEPQLYTTSGPHSSVGVLIAAGIVFFGLLLFSGKFNFSLIYRVSLPLMICGLLLVPAVFPGNSTISNICIIMSYASFTILIMLILSNISYRLGIGAVWLFGIERGLRALIMLGGRELSSVLDNSGLSAAWQETTVTALVIVLLVVATMILLSEKELSSRWGITFLGAGPEGEEDTEQNRLIIACEEIGRKHSLSYRENEVLYLLAQKKSISAIEHELFIANGTVKAHVRHIYEKLGIHSRKELYDMLGIESGVF
ncbi:MAG: helix-turn-helix transcriptional regulator [Actinobacteria bacterium]|nr:helix-turn-helix transcriptional regulator [Actinomycetota bacterium]